MTDEELASQIKGIAKSFLAENLKGRVLAIVPSQSLVVPIDKSEATQYLTKKIGAIFVDIPELSTDTDERIADLALAVGRRLERFERGAKANARRTTETRRKVAQNAIQTRWSAK